MSRMPWLTGRERLTLAGLGLLALAGLGLLLWQRHRPPLTIRGSPSPVEAPRWDDALESARKVDVNTAGVAELERLPGVGPTLAGRIVEHRTRHGRFRSAEGLSQVPGIGPKTLEGLGGYVAVNESP
jgi:competence ComEA-like helix-hairpin-helix protein